MDAWGLGFKAVPVCQFCLESVYGVSSDDDLHLMSGVFGAKALAAADNKKLEVTASKSASSNGRHVFVLVMENGRWFRS